MTPPGLFYSKVEMPKKIKDKFTDLPVSRQRKYQLRMRRAQRCIICGEPAVGKTFCLTHMVRKREKGRKRIGARKRLKGALSYRLQAAK
jgi:hypothetical protein